MNVALFRNRFINASTKRFITSQQHIKPLGTNCFNVTTTQNLPLKFRYLSTLKSDSEKKGLYDSLFGIDSNVASPEFRSRWLMVLFFDQAIL
jgi:hypothetical protein